MRVVIITTTIIVIVTMGVFLGVIGILIGNVGLLIYRIGLFLGLNGKLDRFICYIGGCIRGLDLIKVLLRLGR